MFRKLKLVMLLAVFGMAARVNAQVTENWGRPNSVEEIGGKTYSDGQVYTVILYGDVKLTGTISVTNGSTLIIKPTTSYGYNRNYTITRKSKKDDGAASGIEIRVLGNQNAGDRQSELQILGTSQRRIIIDGGAVYETPGDARTACTNSADCIFDAPLVRCSGNLQMKYVDLCNNYRPRETNTNYTSGLFFPSCDNQTGDRTIHSATLDHVNIYGCYSNAGSAIYMNASNWHLNYEMTDCKVYGNVGESYYDTKPSYGGVVRFTAAASCKATVKGCEIYNNKSVNKSGHDAEQAEAYGGGIYWCAEGMTGSNYDSQYRSVMTIGKDNSGNVTKIYNNETSLNGGGIFCQGEMEIEAIEVYGNKAGRNGGGLSMNTYINNSTNAEVYAIKINVSEDVKIYNNEAGGNGGGCYMSINASNHVIADEPGGDEANFKFSLDGGKIYNNTAAQGGGVYINDDAPATYQSTTTYGPQIPITYKRSVEIKSGSIYKNHATGNGGAIYINKTYEGEGAAGDLDTYINGGDVKYNIAGFEADTDTTTFTTGNGGAIYIANSSNGQANLTIEEKDGKSIKIFNNECGSNGGSIYLDGGNVAYKSGTMENNYALTGDGGGFYVNDGNVNVSSGTIKNNNALQGHGGGFYVTGGNVSLAVSGSDNISIKGNNAIDGGGFYANDGEIEITGAVIESNTARQNGGGFYVNGGTLALEGGTIGSEGHPNDAVNGGGFYVQGGESTISGGEVQHNTATNGAGLYIKGISATNTATATFSDGTFKQNTATSAGGGIYIDEYAELTMTGNSQITDNTVSSGGVGAGVFKRGETKSLILVSGSSSRASAELKIYGNTIGGQPNNLYLDQYDDYLTIDAEGGLPDKMQLGVSVNITTAGDNPLPTRVIRCTDFDILNGIFTKLMEAYEQTHPSKDEDYSFIYDDAERFLPVFASAPQPFTFEYIFFAEVWPSPFPEIPVDFDPGNISTPEELNYFMMKVNGIRCEKDATINGNVVADIDMSGRFWIPIGGYQATPSDEKTPYSGRFHGNGHTISGLECIGLTGTTIYGLFGDTEGATIENLNVVDAKLTSGQADYFGLLVGRMTNGQVLNCNASGTIDASGSGDGKSSPNNYNDGGFIGGLVGGTFGEDVHIKNVISTVDIVAEFHKDNVGNYDNDRYIEDSRTVGGLVGITSAGTVIENGFANPKIEHGSWFPRYVGGLVGYNEGTLTNCYVRLGRGVTMNIKPGKTQYTYNGIPYTYNDAETKSKFGMLAGYNATSNKISYCYYPDEGIRTFTYVVNPEASTVEIVNTGSCDNTCKIYHPVITPYKYETYLVDNQVDGGTTEETTLLSTLNGWVETNGDTYSHWMRTKASDVNDDYPVLSYDNLISTLNYTTVGSKDGIRLEYSNRFNDMYGRFATEGEGCLFVYRTPWGEDENGSEIITADNSGKDIKVFIDDNVAVLQEEGKVLENAYTCKEITGENREWLLLSSALEASPTGFVYEEEGEIEWSDEPDPCDVEISENEVGNYKTFFPSKTTVENIDLYNFYEPEYHWLNLKRNHLSHWHMNNHGANIAYSDDDNLDSGSHLIPGRGYLMAIGLIPTKDDNPEKFLLQAGGKLNNEDIKIDVTAKAGYNNEMQGIPATEGTELKGYNLLGNPYQSYLNFGRFAEANMTILGSNTGYYVWRNGIYVPGSVTEPSEGSFAASGEIGIHEGFFIVAAEGGKVTFTNAMRSDKQTASSAKSRAERPAFPLINLKATDADGEGDIAVVEFGRPEFSAAAKMKQIGADGKIYFHYADDDYALLYLNEDTDQLPVRFDAIEDGTYTMTWSTANATFSYLHLIDNMTGIDVDMLSSDAYSFTASSSDYKSRFKLMFAYTGVEENEAASTSSASFAFMHDGALTVNGEGMLEVIDMSGRTIVSSRLTDAQNTVSLPQAAQGVYVLRLTNDNQSKVQKIVIE